jgi:hypothetical protein
MRFLDRRKNPYFHHAEAEYFLAWRDGEPVGRITAQIDRNFNEYHDQRLGHFGFFEAEDDPEVAAGLVEAAEAWLRERGMEGMQGPFDFTMNDECGVLIEGHEIKPMLRQPWQLRYYPALLESVGLSKAVDTYMWHLHISDREKILPVIIQLAERLEEDHGIKVRHMRKSDLKAEVERFRQVYNAAWKDNWGFVPYTREELEHAAKEFKFLLDERWIMVAEDGGGQVAAAALTFPDLNEVLAQIPSGRLFPTGWWKLLTRRKDIKRVRVGFLGVMPEFQHTGVAAALYVEHFDMAETGPIKEGEMGWILESNDAMNRGMEAMGGRIVKKYRVYEKAFG